MPCRRYTGGTVPGGGGGSGGSSQRGDGRVGGDPAARRVYLRSLPDALVPARHSTGARRRSAQLQRFVRPLEAAARRSLPVEGEVQLLVASASDWRQLCSYPYGLPFARTTGSLVSLVAARDYPQRLLARFDDVLLRAGRNGVRAPADIREFLDLLLGHEWGHAAANRSGLRTRVRWFDELMATFLFAQALTAAGDADSLARLGAWAKVQTAASAGWRGPLDGFEVPRARMKLSRLLWYQGVFTERALALAATRGWGFPEALASRLPSRDRGALARALVEVEPSFRSWFAVFAPDAAGGP